MLPAIAAAAPAHQAPVMVAVVTISLFPMQQVRQHNMTQAQTRPVLQQMIQVMELCAHGFAAPFGTSKQRAPCATGRLTALTMLTTRGKALKRGMMMQLWSSWR